LCLFKTLGEKTYHVERRNPFPVSKDYGLFIIKTILFILSPKWFVKKKKKHLSWAMSELRKEYLD